MLLFYPCTIGGESREKNKRKSAEGEGENKSAKITNQRKIEVGEGIKLAHFSSLMFFLFSLCLSFLYVSSKT